MRSLVTFRLISILGSLWVCCRLAHSSLQFNQRKQLMMSPELIHLAVERRKRDTSPDLIVMPKRSTLC